MTATLNLYDTTGTTVIENNLFVGDISEGGTYSIASFVVKNTGDSTATNIRLFARCLNGLYTSQPQEFGQEAITGQWAELSVNSGAWTPVGGNFAGGSSPSPAGNYVTISDIDAGNQSDQIDARLSVPANVSSAGSLILQIGVSYKE